jgi:hypothetical protein
VKSLKSVKSVVQVDIEISGGALRERSQRKTTYYKEELR